MTHALYVSGAYLVSAVAILGLIGWLVTDGRGLKRDLAELEASGSKRRSER